MQWSTVASGLSETMARFVEPGDIGKVVHQAVKGWNNGVELVEFPHGRRPHVVYHSQLRRYTEEGPKAILDGLPPKRLWSDIDHTGRSPQQQPAGKKPQGMRDGQMDGGHEAKSQDYGTRFVNGNKGVG